MNDPVMLQLRQEYNMSVFLSQVVVHFVEKRTTINNKDDPVWCSTLCWKANNQTDKYTLMCASGFRYPLEKIKVV